MYSNCLRRIVVSSRGLGFSGNAAAASRSFGGRSLGMTSSVASESALENLSSIVQKKQSLEPVLFWTKRGYVTSVVERSAARWNHNYYKSISFDNSTASLRSSLITQTKSLETRGLNYISSRYAREDAPGNSRSGSGENKDEGKTSGDSADSESVKEKLTNLYGYGNTFFGSIIVGFIAFGTWCFYQGLSADDVHKEVSDTGLYHEALKWLGKATDYEAEGPFLQPNTTGSNRPTLIIDAADIYQPEYLPGKGWLRKRRPKSYFLIGTLYANYELVIWHDNESRDNVQANPEYLIKLDPHNLVNHLFIENVSVKMTKKVKNVSRLGRDESRVIVVTSDPSSYSPDSQRNLIVIPKWTGDNNDTDLYDLVFFLDFLAKRGGEGDLTAILQKVKESGKDPVLIGRPLRMRWEKKQLQR